ncbi:hypothetical protein HHK36_021061 [Tetracentron sinense]|uniref:Uncharacterized protein n=1 Tax=Tetracentron sinense TaxID=13715 RepID=A0A835DAA7_TETSI|nr:hypothetical protein HHK36_021060 [Tetracentron sinense]KAF8392824.1 hypothetical protein HHK36_021061 [Tetracentron sinense]
MFFCLGVGCRERNLSDELRSTPNQLHLILFAGSGIFLFPIILSGEVIFSGKFLHLQPLTHLRSVDILSS